MTRRDLPTIALLALCLVLAGRGCAEEAAYAEEIAYADSIADAALDSVVAMREHREYREAVYLIAIAATEDSVAAWRARAESLQAEADSFRARADEVATELVTTMTAEQADLFAGYSAHRDSIEGVLVAQRDDARAEASEWRARHDDVASLYAALQTEAAALDAALLARDAAIAARDDALSARSRQAWYERGAVLAVAAVLVLR